MQWLPVTLGCVNTPLCTMWQNDSFPDKSGTGSSKLRKSYLTGPHSPPCFAQSKSGVSTRSPDMKAHPGGSWVEVSCCRFCPSETQAAMKLWSGVSHKKLLYIACWSFFSTLVPLSFVTAMMTVSEVRLKLCEMLCSCMSLCVCVWCGEVSVSVCMLMHTCVTGLTGGTVTISRG